MYWHRCLYFQDYLTKYLLSIDMIALFEKVLLPNLQNMSYISMGQLVVKISRCKMFRH